MTISLIRHGMTQANLERLYCGSTDLSLAEEGIKQLRQLKNEIAYPAAEFFVSSGMKRAMETLGVLYDREPDRVIRELNEYAFGDFEMKTHEQIQDHPAYIRWFDGNDQSRCPGGESWGEFRARIRQGFDQVQKIAVEKKLSDVAVICHGGVIACLMEMMFPDAKKSYYEWLPVHGRGYAVEYSDGPISWQPLG